MSDEPHSLVPSRRIAFVLPNMAGGGAERVALALVTDLVKRGHDIDLVLIEASGELLSLLPPQVVVVDLKARRIMSALPALIRYLRDRQPDAVHAMMWLSGRRDSTMALWAVLMFQAWLDNQSKPVQLAA